MADRDEEELLDQRVAAAIDRFLSLAAQHRTMGIATRDRIADEFLKEFGDGDPRRADGLVALAPVVSTAMEQFDRRLQDLSEKLLPILGSKFAAVTSVTLLIAATGRDVGVQMHREVMEAASVVDWIRAAAAGKSDPGPMPDRPEITDFAPLMKQLAQIKDDTFTLGRRVALSIEFMGDVIELRLAHLNAFKLNHLKLNVLEMLERIQSRFGSDPATRGFDVLLQLLKGTIVAIVGTAIEKHLPWSTITDLLKRLETSLLGARASAAPGGADVLMNLETDLGNQERFLTLVADVCDATLRDLEALNAAVSAALKPPASDA